MNTSLYKEATTHSLENAEQWIKDAKCIIDSGSYGHGYSLLLYAIEESVKAQVCWLASENMIPVGNNKFINLVFSDHKTKYEYILGFIMISELNKALSENKIMREQFTEYLKDIRLNINENLFRIVEEIIGSTANYISETAKLLEKERQKGIYVGKNDSDKKIITPQNIRKEETEK